MSQQSPARIDPTLQLEAMKTLIEVRTEAVRVATAALNRAHHFLNNPDDASLLEALRLLTKRLAHQENSKPPGSPRDRAVFRLYSRALKELRRLCPHTDDIYEHTGTQSSIRLRLERECAICGTTEESSLDYRYNSTTEPELARQSFAILAQGHVLENTYPPGHIMLRH